MEIYFHGSTTAVYLLGFVLLLRLSEVIATQVKKERSEGYQDYEFSASQMPAIRPIKPQQENFSDCGIYLLHYTEKIFARYSKYGWSYYKLFLEHILFSVANFLEPCLPDLTNWFTLEEVGRKRAKIAELIRGMATKQNPGENIIYPESTIFF